MTEMGIASVTDRPGEKPEVVRKARRSSAKKRTKATSARAAFRRKKDAPVGMPAARPFSLEGKEMVFLVRNGPFEDYTSSELRRLVGVGRHDVAAFEDHLVWGFSRPELEYILNELDLYVEQRKGSSHPNAEWVILRYKRGLPSDVRDLDLPRMLEHRFEVTRQARDEMREPSGMLYLTARLLGPVVNKKIIFDVPHAHPRSYDERGGFQVNIWSTHGSQARNESTPRTIWGNRVDCTDPAYPPAQDAGSLPIRDGSYAVADLLPNALYVHHDMVHHGTSRERAIMARLCEEVRAILSDKKSFAKALKANKKAWVVRQRELFADLVTKSIPARQVRIKDEIDIAKQRSASALRAYVDAERAVFNLEQSVLDREAVAARFQAEFAKLQNGEIDLVEDVSIDVNRSGGPVLRVQTKEIIAVDRATGIQYMLGRYDLMLYLSEGRMRFLNKERTPGGNHGPHLDNSGMACLGNISRDLAAFIANYEIEAAVTLAIAFLQNPNTSDAQGRVVYEFPVYARPEGGTR